MRFKLFLLSAAAVLASSANAADWTGYSGTVTGGYNYSDLDGAANNAFNFGGAANYALPDTPLNVQGLVNYAENKIDRIAADTWTSGGAITWRDPAFVIGFAGDYNNTKILGNGLHYGTYGLVGEYYGLDQLGYGPITLRLNGGGLSGSFAGFSGDGGYYGGGASYYFQPRLALNVSGSYATVSNLRWSTFETGLKYLPSDTLPVTIEAAYQHSNVGFLGGSTHTDGLMIRLAYHFNQGSTLVDIDRNGPIATGSPALPYAVLSRAIPE